jgi:hypothetical protein
MWGKVLFDAVVDEIRERCTRVSGSLSRAGSPLVTYTAAFTAYASSMRKISGIFAYLNRLYVARADDRRVMCLAAIATAIWRDVVLRKCIDRLVRDAAMGGSTDHAAEVLETSNKKMFFDAKGNRLVVDISTLSELQKRLKAEPVMFELFFRPGWTKKSHHMCSDGTRDAVTTLLLVRQRLKVKHDGVADIPRGSLFDTWWQIAKFLPTRW